MFVPSKNSIPVGLLGKSWSTMVRVAGRGHPLEGRSRGNDPPQRNELPYFLVGDL